jgi:peptidoglycan/xylan/chitin deacetylase (PgdA/CDA1 family)
MWSGSCQCAVTLSVDFDAETLWSGTFKLRTPSPLSRGDYDVRAALPRIHALLDKHEIPATFMVPAQVADEHPDACAEIAARGRHEIGYHGYYHESVLELPIEDERELMKRGIARLEETFESTPRGNRSPPFALGPNTADLLEEFGFAYDSSLFWSQHCRHTWPAGSEPETVRSDTAPGFAASVATAVDELWR